MTTGFILNAFCSNLVLYDFELLSRTNDTEGLRSLIILDETTKTKKLSRDPIRIVEFANAFFVKASMELQAPKSLENVNAWRDVTRVIYEKLTMFFKASENKHDFSTLISVCRCIEKRFVTMGRVLYYCSYIPEVEKQDFLETFAKISLADQGCVLFALKEIPKDDRLALKGFFDVFVLILPKLSSCVRENRKPSTDPFQSCIDENEEVNKERALLFGKALYLFSLIPLEYDALFLEKISIIIASKQHGVLDTLKTVSIDVCCEILDCLEVFKTVNLEAFLKIRENLPEHLRRLFLKSLKSLESSFFESISLLAPWLESKTGVCITTNDKRIYLKIDCRQTKFSLTHLMGHYINPLVAIYGVDCFKMDVIPKVSVAMKELASFMLLYEACINTLDLSIYNYSLDQLQRYRETFIH